MNQNPKARRSQLVSTYGIGSLFPSENSSFMVAGLEYWQPKDEDAASEPRLARSLGVRRLLQPPAGTNRDVPVIRFPRWQTCPKCHRLGSIRDFQSDWNQAMCGHCKPKVPLSPSRLIVACMRGHIDDFPYFRWLHAGSILEGGDTSHIMRLEARGRTSSLADMQLTCSCGVRPTSLDGSFDAGALVGLVRCRGDRPWLGPDAKEDCGETLRTLQRGASNVWFPAVRSAISIPPYSEAVARFIDREWSMVEDIVDLESDPTFARLAKKASGRFTAEELRMEVARRRGEDTDDDSGEDSLRRDEFAALMHGQHETADSQFVCLATDVPSELASVVITARKVTRLREVRALHGFSRIVGASDTEDDALCKLSVAPADWLPAIEVIGEGIFLAFDTNEIKDWANSSFANSRRQLLQTASNQAAAAAGRHVPTEIDIAYVTLHTFAHMMIDQLALDAGYPAASIRERLYCGDDMAGVLLYTATSDAAGSLGGLAAQAESSELGRAIDEALGRLSWCSSDPVCIESNGSGSDGLNLAACHACVLVPETSCERMNVLLDRGLLFGTPEEPAAGFLSHLLLAQ